MNIIIKICINFVTTITALSFKLQGTVYTLFTCHLLLAQFIFSEADCFFVSCSKGNLTRVSKA